MTKRILRHGQWLPALAVAIWIAAQPGVSAAQGLENKEAIDTIIGTEVQEEEAEAKADAGKVIAAIDKTVENTSTVRKTSNLAKVDIVFLSDATATEGGPPPEIESKIEEHSDEIDALRQEIEGNAMLYHALDSRAVLIRDVLALEFDGENGVVIYAASKPN